MNTDSVYVQNPTLNLLVTLILYLARYLTSILRLTLTLL